MEHTKITVSDTNAESSVIENRETIDENESRPFDVTAAVGDSIVGGSREALVELGTDFGVNNR